MISLFLIAFSFVFFLIAAFWGMWVTPAPSPAPAAFRLVALGLAFDAMAFFLYALAGAHLMPH